MSTRRFGITLDSAITEDSRHRYMAMISVDDNVESDGEFVVQNIGDGNYAGFMHYGGYENLWCTCMAIFLKWLPVSGMSLRNSVLFDEYINRDLSRPKEDYKTIIYLPVK